MAIKTNKTLLIIILVLLIGSLTVGIVAFRKQVKSFFTNNLPGLTQLGTVNLPGKLFGPTLNSRASNLSASEIIKWTNFYRAQEGLPALTLNLTLAKAAQTKVADMFEEQYFEHVSPTGTSPADLVMAAGYDYKVTGENLALGDFKDEKDLVDAWMASPGHRANILNKDYTQIGVSSSLGKFQDRASTWMSVQEFGTPAPDCAKPSATLADSIKTKKSDYQNLADEMNRLAKESEELSQQANAKIQEGNELYKSTHDRDEAEILWTEGESLRAQAEADLAKAQQYEAQLKKLYQEINTLVNQYNSQVDSYNDCIK